MEIESRLLPCGLHIVGQPPTAAEAIATLVNIAEIDRIDNDPPIAGLPGILARTIGRNVEEIYLNNNKVPPPHLNAEHAGASCSAPAAVPAKGCCAPLLQQHPRTMLRQ